MTLIDILLPITLAVVASIIAFAVWRWRRVTAAKVIREFKNVFFNRTEADRERLISFWMNRSGCNRTEAMRLAIENWRQDQRAWR
jgi:hypothetical protein